VRHARWVLSRVAILAFAITSVIVPLVAPPAGAIGFNRDGAVADADYSWNKSYAHPWERFGGTDCTNFVSQAWYFGGGLPMTSGWYLRDSNAWWRGNRDWSTSWTVALNFADYMVNGWRIASYYYADVSHPYNPASKGDAILYNWGRGEGWSHLSIEAGWDSSRDFIDQHDTDRYHSDWNLGWKLERDPSVRSKMGAYVVHVN
jgi:hypothetical protein